MADNRSKDINAKKMHPNAQGSEQSQNPSSPASLLVSFSNTMKEYNLANISYKGKDDQGNDVEIKLESNIYSSNQFAPQYQATPIVYNPSTQTPPMHTMVQNNNPNNNQTNTQANNSTNKPSEESANTHIIKSPMIGVIYVAPKPDAPAFIKVGDKIKQGQDIFIIECMKTMNLVKANTSGTVKEILIKNAQPVEYDEKLVVIELD